jgi:DNA polymerase III epsilon subunit-like protein
MTVKIDNRKKWLAVFDTETTGRTVKGALGFPLIYDIGWVIGDKYGNKAIEREFIVQEVFYNKIMENAFYGKKMPMYWERIGKADILVRSFREILKQLNDDLSLFKNKDLMAYNMNFDLRALRSTAEFCGLTSKGNKDNQLLFTEKQNFQDIWGLAVETLALPEKEDFYDFVETYELLTPSGNPKTSAEVIYRYINNDPDFIEDHTALSDARIEYEIAVKALATRQKFFKGILPNPWQKVRRSKRG